MASVFKKKGKGFYIVSWYDHTGKRREKSSKTTDKRTAERIAARHESETALRREGVVDPHQDRFIANERIPLAKHIEAYLDHCEHVGHPPKHLAEKRRHLGRVCAETGVHCMSDLTADLVEGCLRSMRDKGLSDRTTNFCRQTAVAFMNWVVQPGRIETNAITVIPKLDESQDRRRIRRPLTDDKLCRLMSVAEPRGRKLWYLMAVLAGLRKSELASLLWADIDLERGTITIRDGNDSDPQHRVSLVTLFIVRRGECPTPRRGRKANSLPFASPSRHGDRTAVWFVCSHDPPASARSVHRPRHQVSA